LNGEDKVCGFKTEGHGDDVVCAAVSVLCINAVNSLEALTDAKLEYEYDPDGGFIKCLVDFSAKHDGARLLMDSLVMGLEAVKKNYGLEITNIYKR
jgi:hypothetical protein